MKYGELNKIAREKNLEPMPARFEWLYENTLSAEEFKQYPNMIVNMNGQINLCISDPAAVQDMMVTKNAQIDKTGEF